MWQEIEQPVPQPLFLWISQVVNVSKGNRKTWILLRKRSHFSRYAYRLYEKKKKTLRIIPLTENLLRPNVYSSDDVLPWWPKSSENVNDFRCPVLWDRKNLKKKNKNMLVSEKSHTSATQTSGFLQNVSDWESKLLDTRNNSNTQILAGGLGNVEIDGSWWETLLWHIHNWTVKHHLSGVLQMI